MVDTCRLQLPKTASAKLRTYIEQRVKTVGEAMLLVGHAGKTAGLPWPVVEGHSLADVGRDWLQELEID